MRLVYRRAAEIGEGPEVVIIIQLLDKVELPHSIETLKPMSPKILARVVSTEEVAKVSPRRHSLSNAEKMLYDHRLHLNLSSLLICQKFYMHSLQLFN